MLRFGELTMTTFLPLFAPDGAGGGGEGANPAPGNGGGDGGNSGNAGGGQTETFDRAYVEKLRQEAASYRTKAKELEGKIEATKTETVTAILKALGIDPDPAKSAEQQVQAAKAKAQEAEARANERLIRGEIRLLADRVGLDPRAADDAYMLMDKAKVTVADDGTVQGVEEALKALLEAKPYLMRQTAQPVGSGSNPANGGNAPADLRQQYEAAMKSGNIALAIALKDQMTR
mgnify:CR=1 FL=1